MHWETLHLLCNHTIEYRDLMTQVCLQRKKSKRSIVHACKYYIYIQNDEASYLSFKRLDDTTTPFLLLIIPNSLLPRLSRFGLPLLPLLLLRPSLPLLLPHNPIILPLLLRPPRRPYPQRPRNHPPRHRRRLLRPLIQARRTIPTPRSLDPNAIPHAVAVWVLELRGRGRSRGWGVGRHVGVVGRCC